MRKIMVQKIGIIGGGVMGSDLARFFLSKDFPVIIVEARDDLAEKARQKVKQSFLKDLNKGKITQKNMDQWLSGFVVDTDRKALAAADLVIEAVSEDLLLKRQVLASVEQVVAPGAMLATNTSALPISALAVALSHPERFVGTHFFNPAHIMPLVEVVPGGDTSGEVLEQIGSFLSKLGKKPIFVKDCPGFLVNRVLGAYMNEVFWLLEEQVGIQVVEQAAQELGLPMGPITLGEMVGWDIIHASNTTLATYYGIGFQIPFLLTRLVSERRFGLKSGRGLFDYSSTPPRATHDLFPTSVNLGASDLEAVKVRLRNILIAESLRCLDEKVATAHDVDQALMLGAGLPKGPVAWADELGLDLLLDQLQDLSNRFGARFWPSPILRIYVLAGLIGRSAGRGLAGNYHH
jgi:3-hydroxyacyl-CoA dehydrogenase